MKQPGRYNPSLTMPIIDIVAAIVLAVGAGLLWHHTRGEAQIQAEQTERLRAREENAVELSGPRNALAATCRELDEVLHLQDMRAQQLQYLEEQIGTEREDLRRACEQNEPLVNQVRALHVDIETARKRRTIQRNEIREHKRELKDGRALVTALETQAEQRRAEIAAGDEQLREAPPNRLPRRSTVVVMAEFATAGPVFLAGISRSIGTLRNCDLGVLGSFGLHSDGRTALVELGVCADLPLPPHWAALDVVGGIRWQQMRSAGPDPETGPFVAAHVRLAPISRERLFILAGVVLAHHDAALRLGVRLGGR